MAARVVLSFHLLLSLCDKKTKNRSLKKNHLNLGSKSGRKVVFRPEHGTTGPARGAESRNPMSSGKRSIDVISNGYVSEEGGGEEARRGGEHFREEDA